MPSKRKKITRNDAVGASRGDMRPNVCERAFTAGLTGYLLYLLYIILYNGTLPDVVLASYDTTQVKGAVAVGVLLLFAIGETAQAVLLAVAYAATYAVAAGYLDKLLQLRQRFAVAERFDAQRRTREAMENSPIGKAWQTDTSFVRGVDGDFGIKWTEYPV